jgi:AraC family transcriptional regulator
MPRLVWKHASAIPQESEIPVDRLTLTAAHEFLNVEGHLLCDPNLPRSASCAVMQVTYLPNMERASLEPVRDRIEILVPGEQGVFHAMYETADGRTQRAVARGPNICVIPANQPHRLTCQRPADMVAVSLDQAFFASRTRDAFGCTREVVERYAAVDPFLRGIGNVLRSAFRVMRTPTSAYLESLASVIAIHVAANYDRRDSAPPTCTGLAPHKLQRVLAFIEERLAESIRVRELASAVHMSPYHFARMFKQATGQPPHVYITSQRMDQAKNLLGNSDLSLVEVAASVGYQTQAHFTGVFHKHVGVTPRTFRMKCRAERRVA